MSEQAPSWWSGNALSYAQKKGSAEMKKLNYKRFKASGAVLGFAVFGIFMRLKSETQVQLDLEAEKLSKANADYRRAVLDQYRSASLREIRRLEIRNELWNVPKR
eukprot:650181_1